MTPAHLDAIAAVLGLLVAAHSQVLDLAAIVAGAGRYRLASPA